MTEDLVKLVDDVLARGIAILSLQYDSQTVYEWLRDARTIRSWIAEETKPQ